MVFDGFLFFKELDLLEIRLNILDKWVDYFVLTESTKTFSGLDKPLYYLENKDRFSKFNDRILHNIVEDTPDVDVWERERFQRNAIKRGFDGICEDNDIIITGDVDEIPDMYHVLKNFSFNDVLYRPLQTMYYYYLNLEKERNWLGSCVYCYKYLNNRSVDEIRNIKSTGLCVQIPNGGWHFSFLGGVEMIKDKLSAYGHQEFNNDYIKNNLQSNIDNNRDIFFRNDVQLKRVDIDNTFPKYILDNQQKYSRLFL